MMLPGALGRARSICGAAPWLTRAPARRVRRSARRASRARPDAGGRHRGPSPCAPRRAARHGHRCNSSERGGAAPARARAPAPRPRARRAEAVHRIARAVRLTEYIQAVEAGMIPSHAPAGATAPPQPQFFEAAHGASTNHYARADGQARACPRRAHAAPARAGGCADGASGLGSATPFACVLLAPYLTPARSRARAQNLGNFLTDRNSSRVLAPPGGASSIVFGA